MTCRPFAAALLAASLLAAPATFAAPSPYVPGEVLVKFRPGTGVQRRAAAFAARAHAAVADLDHGWMHVRVGLRDTVESALASYAADPEVEDAQPNFIYRAALAPDARNTLYGQEWFLKNTGQTISSGVQPVSGPLYGANPGTPTADIDVEAAWGHVTDCSSAIVAVLDTGVNYNHQDLAANMWNGGASYPNHGRDFVGAGDNDPIDENGHGTHVAGIIAADGTNNLGAVGVCWRARVMAVRVLDQFGAGPTSAVIQGLNFAAANGAKIVNMSLGGGGTFDTAYSNAVTAAQNAGVLMVVAAGNENSNVDATPSYPCSFTQPNILCVAALDQQFGLASFSNFGATKVDVGAPGTNILSTWPGTHVAVNEDFSSGWFVNPSSVSGGWGLASLDVGGSAVTFLTAPSSYPSAFYAPNADLRAWKSYNLAGAHVVSVEAQVAIDLVAGDTVRAACATDGNDPFNPAAPGRRVLGSDSSGVQTGGTLTGLNLDASACAAATTGLGFGLVSQAGSPGNYGIAVAPFKVSALTRNTTSYNTIHGTSMATPVVAGIAALLRAYNPSFTFADTINAIVGGGVSVPALAGKTTTGKAVQTMASLAFVSPPTGLTWAER